MSDAVHLKLDRILAGQEDHAERLADISGAQAAILDALRHQVVPLLGSLRETVQRLLDAASAEDPGGGDLSRLIARIEAQLGEQTGVLHQLKTALLELPGQIEAATIDGVRLATGDGVAPRPNGHAG